MKAAVRAHPIAAYFILAYAGCWVIWVPVLLSKQGLAIMSYDITLPLPLFLVVSTITGPALAALVVQWAAEGQDGVRILWRRLSHIRVNVLWYLLVLFGPPLLLVAGATVWFGLAPISGLATHLLLLVTSFVPAAALGLIVTVFEETGWMGVAFPRLQAAHGPLFACAILGPLWAIWHLPSFFVSGSGGAATTGVNVPLILLQLGVLSVVAIAIRITAGWIFNATAGAVPLIMIGHSALDQAPDYLKALNVPNLRGDALDWVFYGGVAGAAFVVVLLTRGRLGLRPAEKTIEPVAVP